jgi:hypothetical protein
MKKEIKAWAIKARGRSFYQDTYGIPFLYPTRRLAAEQADRIADWKNRNPMNRSRSTEVVRVRVRIEEIT